MIINLQQRLLNKILKTFCEIIYRNRSTLEIRSKKYAQPLRIKNVFYFGINV